MRSAQAGKKSRRREKQRDESRLQQHAVGLIAGKILRGAHERKKAHEADEQRGARPDVEDQQQRSDHPDPADCAQHVRAGGEPQQRRRKPEAGHAELARHCFEIFVGGKNSVRADESADLKDQREEGRKINQAERAQKDPARKQAVRRAIFRIEPPANEGRRRPSPWRSNYIEDAETASCSATDQRGNKRKRRTARPSMRASSLEPAAAGEPAPLTRNRMTAGSALFSAFWLSTSR